VDRATLIGGALRGALSAGSMVRLAQWVKSRPGRGLGLQLYYDEQGAACWTIQLTEQGQTIVSTEADTLETAIGAAVVKIGV
jgi:hypothetical protein